MSPDDKYGIGGENFHAASYFSLFFRVIPLMLSFLLFAFAATANVKTVGVGAIQTALGAGFILGIVGLAMFIPKRVKHLNGRIAVNRSGER
jgi:hypothetical protein